MQNHKWKIIRRQLLTKSPIELKDKSNLLDTIANCKI